MPSQGHANDPLLNLKKNSWVCSQPRCQISLHLLNKQESWWFKSISIVPVLFLDFPLIAHLGHKGLQQVYNHYIQIDSSPFLYNGDYTSVTPPFPSISSFMLRIISVSFKSFISNTTRNIHFYDEQLSSLKESNLS